MNNLQESFVCCDYIILLDVNTYIRLFRVFRRWIRQSIEEMSGQIIIL